MQQLTSGGAVEKLLSSSLDQERLGSILPLSDLNRVQVFSTLSSSQQTLSSGSLSSLQKSLQKSLQAVARSLSLSGQVASLPDPFMQWLQSCANQAQTVWLLNGVSIGQTRSTKAANLSWDLQGIGDFTGDGQSDILWHNPVSNLYSISVFDGAVYQSEISLAASGSRQLQGIGDFNGDGKADLLWRNFLTGENTIGLSNGSSFAQEISLPSLPGSNVSVEAVGDFNQDGRADILWRNYLSGEVVAWLLDATGQVAGTSLVATAPDLNWQIEAAADLNQDGKTDLLWRNAATGQTGAWAMDGLTYAEMIDLPSGWDQTLTFAAPHFPSATGLATVTNLSFSGQEGDRGTFQIQLTQAPTANVTLSFNAGNFLTIDADANIQNGTQNTLTFTPLNWNLPQTVSFIAEVDGSSQSRLWGNTVSYSLSGGLVSNGVYELATVTNTYAPDPTRFNIDLDFRNDYLGFWTPARKAIAQQAANEWASRIANEWPDFQLGNTIARLDSDLERTTSFTTQRYVDDLVIFINNYQVSSIGEGGLASPDYEFGGWWTLADDGVTPVGTMPRVAQIAINPAFANYSDLALYQVLSHELGHTLGLLGLNWTGYTLEDRSTPQTAVFKGAYSTAANGGKAIPLQSQDGGDYSHPAASVVSVMSYGWIYQLSAPTAIDSAFLADSGYKVYGINA